MKELLSLLESSASVEPVQARLWGFQSINSFLPPFGEASRPSLGPGSETQGLALLAPGAVVEGLIQQSRGNGLGWYVRLARVAVDAAGQAVLPWMAALGGEVLAQLPSGEVPLEERLEQGDALRLVVLRISQDLSSIVVSLDATKLPRPQTDAELHLRVGRIGGLQGIGTPCGKFNITLLTDSRSQSVGAVTEIERSLGLTGFETLLFAREWRDYCAAPPVDLAAIHRQQDRNALISNLVQGAAALQMKDVAVAQECFAEALRLDPSVRECHLGMANVYRMLSAWDKAVEHERMASLCVGEALRLPSITKIVEVQSNVKVPSTAPGSQKHVPPSLPSQQQQHYLQQQHHHQSQVPQQQLLQQEQKQRQQLPARAHEQPVVEQQKLPAAASAPRDLTSLKTENPVSKTEKLSSAPAPAVAAAAAVAQQSPDPADEKQFCLVCNSMEHRANNCKQFVCSKCHLWGHSSKFCETNGIRVEDGASPQSLLEWELLLAEQPDMDSWASPEGNEGEDLQEPAFADSSLAARSVLRAGSESIPESQHSASQEVSRQAQQHAASPSPKLEEREADRHRDSQEYRRPVSGSGRRNRVVCHNCNEEGHIRPDCPKLRPGRRVEVDADNRGERAVGEGSERRRRDDEYRRDRREDDGGRRDDEGRGRRDDDGAGRSGRRSDGELFSGGRGRDESGRREYDAKRRDDEMRSGRREEEPSGKNFRREDEGKRHGDEDAFSRAGGRDDDYNRGGRRRADESRRRRSRSLSPHGRRSPQKKPFIGAGEVCAEFLRSGKCTDPDCTKTHIDMAAVVALFAASQQGTK